MEDRKVNWAHPVLRRFMEAYKLMAAEARYRPQAPGDGMGNVNLSREEAACPARLDKEAAQYAAAFLEEEDSNSFWVGCSGFDTNRAFVFTIEAARQLAGGELGNKTAKKLLQMALDEIEAVAGRAKKP